MTGSPAKRVKYDSSTLPASPSKLHQLPIDSRKISVADPQSFSPLRNNEEFDKENVSNSLPPPPSPIISKDMILKRKRALPPPMPPNRGTPVRMRPMSGMDKDELDYQSFPTRMSHTLNFSFKKKSTVALHWRIGFVIL